LEKFFIIGAVNCRGKKEGSSATDSLSEDVTDVTEVRKFVRQRAMYGILPINIRLELKPSANYL
jgi:hypothetical protein